VLFPYVMKTKLPSRLSLPAGVALALCAGGCSNSEAATRPAPTQATPESAGVHAGARSDNEKYTAEIKASGSYAPGAQGTVDVTLAPKGGYHINAQYPYKFKVTDPAPEGVTFPKPLLARADGSFEETKGSFHVPFVAAKAGRVTVGGTLYLSVCSDANCIIEKEPLEVAVDVK
jgi:hypothetical protein